MTIEIGRESGVARVTVSGELTPEIVTTAFDAMLGHADFRPGMNSLWDARQASFQGLDAKDVRLVVAHVQQRMARRGRAKAAIVVAEDLAFGLSRMYEVLAEQHMDLSVRVFRDLDEAQDWLGG